MESIFGAIAYPMSLLKRIALWTWICCVCGGPSIFIAYTKQADHFATIVGVLIFIAIYVAVTGTEIWCRIWQNDIARKAINTGFILRILLSIVVPVGLVIDVLVASLTYKMLGYDEHRAPKTPGITLVLTLLQGVLLNLILWGFIGFQYAVMRMYKKPEPESGKCIRCGYDLRASPIRCPECGEATPAHAVASRQTEASPGAP